MILSDEELEVLSDLAGIGYTDEQLALYFDYPFSDFRTELRNTKSRIAIAYRSGKLATDAEIMLKQTESAKKGNITSAQLVRTKQAENKADALRKKYLYG